MSSPFFKPPFTQANFSTTIKVTLFQGEPDASILPRYVDESVYHLVQNTFAHNNIAVIGYYSFGIGFFIDLDQNDTAVYTLYRKESKTQLIKIADSLDVFYEMLIRTLVIWQSDIKNDFLPQNPTTFNKEKALIHYFEKNSPGSSPIFWQLYFFSDLHIGLE